MRSRMWKKYVMASALSNDQFTMVLMKIGTWNWKLLTNNSDSSLNIYNCS